MQNMKYLLCHSPANGFTVNHVYDILEGDGRFITVLNDNLERVKFDSIERENDFKNHFYGRY